MSEGQFIRSFYSTDAGNTAKMRVQPETLAATIGGTANAAPAGPATVGFPSVQISRSRRSLGVHARFVTFAWTTPPAGYDPNGLVSLPVPDPTVFAGIADGEAVAYLGGDGEVVSKTPELIR